VAGLTEMINNYDFESVLSQAVAAEQERQIAWQNNQTPSIQELLTKLQAALGDQTRVM